MKRNPDEAPDHDEILARLQGIRLSQRRFEDLAGLPRNFITQAKSGVKFRTDESAHHWIKAAAALDQLDARPTKGGPKPFANPNSIVPPELLTAIQKLSTEEDALLLQRMLIEYAARGLVSNSFLKIANDSLSRFQQLTRQKREAQDVQRGDEPVRVVVLYVNPKRIKR